MGLHSFPKEEILTRLKGIVIGAPTAPTMLISEEEEPISRREDVIPPLASTPMGSWLKKRSYLLSRSPWTTLEERVTRLASFIFDRAPGTLSIL